MSAIETWRDAYVESGSGSAETRRAFRAMAAERGLTVERRGSLLLARDAAGRVVGFLDTRPRDGNTERVIPNTPCVSCGAAPVGTFHDGSERYGCGPHPVVYAEETR